MDFRELIKFREYKSELMGKFVGLFDFMELIIDPNMHQPVEENIDENLRASSLIRFDNGLILSVFGSNTAYSIPRKNLHVYDYQALELAFYYSGYRGDEFLEIHVQMEMLEFKKKLILGEFFHRGVYRRVPIDLIQEVFDFLKNKYGLIT